MWVLSGSQFLCFYGGMERKEFHLGFSYFSEVEDRAFYKEKRKTKKQRDFPLGLVWYIRIYKISTSSNHPYPLFMALFKACLVAIYSMKIA